MLSGFFFVFLLVLFTTTVVIITPLAILSSSSSRMTTTKIALTSFVRRKLLAEPDGIIDSTISSILDHLDSNNISQQILWAVGNFTPAINETKGIDDLTRAFQRLIPVEVRDQLVRSFPDHKDFPSTWFWELVASWWNEFEQKSDEIQHELQDSGFLNRARNTVKRYNDFIEWRTDMPFARYDQKVDGFRNLTKPFYQSRSNFINTRDEVLEALLNRQKASWEPVVNASLQARVQIEEKRAKADQIANELALGRISHTIFDVRSLFNKLQTNKIYLTHTAKLCALNPACCSNPQLCAPIQLRQQF